MRNQQLQTDYTEDMVGYWKERSHTYIAKITAVS